MPGWLSTILQIILFIVCLSTLVLVHEAGHLAAAKAFGVYCDDFSIGFGKAFLHKRRKNGETYFSLRVVPFGGYVSMASDEGEIEEGKFINKERTINGIKKWKSAIIMSAGIIMNIVLSILLFYIYNQCFITVNVPYINAFSALENTPAWNAGITTYDPKTGEGDFASVSVDPRYPNNGEQIWYYSLDSLVHYEDGTSEPIAVTVHQNQATVSNTNFDNLFHYYLLKDLDVNYQIEGQNEPITITRQVADFENEITFETENISHLVINFPTFSPKNGSYYCSYCHDTFNQENNNINELEFTTQDGTIINYNDISNYETYYARHKNCPYMEGNDKLTLPGSVSINAEGSVKTMTLNLNQDKTGFESSGLSLFKTEHWQDFGEAWTNAFVQFGEGAGLIFRTLGGLFVGQGWENVGSIVSIYTSTSSILSDMGVSYFIYYWGLISVNLAIFNLLPFPGLDGWQLLVIAIEGISRKKVPEKAKSIMSFIGMALLFGLMIILIIKDIVGLF